MAVFASFNSHINPGRRMDAIALAQGAAKLVERHGANRPRLLATSTAGELVDGLVFVTEFATLADHGAFTDELAADGEIQSLLDQVSGPQSPVTPQAQMLSADVALGGPTPTEHGLVTEVYILRVRPGGLEAFLASTQRYRDLVEAHGSVGARLLTVVHGGSQTGLYVSTAEYADHQSWGRATDAWTTTPEGQALSADLASGAIPADIVTSGLYVEIPL